MGGAIVALVGMISRLNKKQTDPIHERAERSANRWSVPSLGGVTQASFAMRATLTIFRLKGTEAHRRAI
jgi:hypothetical protein